MMVTTVCEISSDQNRTTYGRALVVNATMTRQWLPLSYQLLLLSIIADAS